MAAFFLIGAPAAIIVSTWGQCRADGQEGVDQGLCPAREDKVMLARSGAAWSRVVGKSIPWMQAKCSEKQDPHRAAGMALHSAAQHNGTQWSEALNSAGQHRLTH